MDLRVQLVAIAGSLLLLLTVLELVRRRRFLERYALLWLVSGVCLLALAVWKGLLDKVANAIGIYYAPSALFVIAFGFIMLLLLHFSVAVSKLADQSKVLAQRLAILEERQKTVEAERDEARRALAAVEAPAERPSAVDQPADRFARR
jgi:hypothetical protein